MGGAPCPKELCERLISDMHMSDIQVGYGTTETSPVSFLNILDDPPEARVRSFGHVLEHVEVRSPKKINFFEFCSSLNKKINFFCKNLNFLNSHPKLPHFS